MGHVAGTSALLALQHAISRSTGGTVALLAAVGVLLGVAFAPTLAYNAAVDPAGPWRAAGATALFIAFFGAIGYGTARDLSAVASSLLAASVFLDILNIFVFFLPLTSGDN